MFADYETGVAVPARKTLAERMGCSVDTVDRLKAELIDAKALTVRKRKVEGRLLNDTNEYVIHRIPPGGRTDAATWPQTDAEGGRTRAAQTRTTPNENSSSPSETPSLEVEVIRSAWQGESVLISHREPYFTRKDVVRAIRNALKTYPIEDVVQAIKNYATVLGGREYRWNYKWTLEDFLNRGLDKFVPEADPLGNYRDRKAAPSERRTDYGF